MDNQQNSFNNMGQQPFQNQQNGQTYANNSFGQQNGFNPNMQQQQAPAQPKQNYANTNNAYQQQNTYSPPVQSSKSTEKLFSIIQFVATGIFLLLGVLYMNEEVLNDFAWVGFAGAAGFGTNAFYLLKKSKE